MRIAADDFCGIFLAVKQGDRNTINGITRRATGNNMVVRDDVAIRRNQKARATARLFLRNRTAFASEGVQAGCDLHLLLGRNVDHGGLELNNQIGKARRGTGRRQIGLRRNGQCRLGGYGRTIDQRQSASGQQ